MKLKYQLSQEFIIKAIEEHLRSHYKTTFSDNQDIYISFSEISGVLGDEIVAEVEFK